MRFLRRRITLPLFECDWQSLKSELRQHSLPKVQFAIKTLPKEMRLPSNYPACVTICSSLRQ
jgi:hypothetical protein